MKVQEYLIDGTGAAAIISSWLDMPGGIGISGGNGITVANTDTPNLTLLVTNNTVSGTDSYGILLVGRGVTGTANFKVAYNNVSSPVNAGGQRQGIRVDAGNFSNVEDAVCLNITGNVSAGSKRAHRKEHV